MLNSQNMKKIILLVAIAISLSAISVSAQTKVRVKFAKNQYEKTVSGSVGSTSYVEYLIRIERYNFIEVNLSSGSKTLAFTIRNPKGTKMSEGVDVRTFSGEADSTGDYVIRVYNRESAKGTKNFRLKVSAFMGT
jgi:hypothetical protein